MLKKFWQAVGRRVWLSDYKDSMMPRTTFRSPAPVSQPKYRKPVTAASDIYNNPYYRRDVRRNYPRTEVYTQTDIGTLLLGTKAAEALPEANGKHADGAGAADVAVAKAKDVVEALDKLQKPVYSASSMPPVPGTPYIYKLSPEQHAEGPGEYYPSYRVY
ncbi:hypothetical protein GGI25_000916 [Coemansia spiralis]|uniref:Uncharacterized protein n=2 Tax=Coemansia TaxID=4863 RepID=A0A9W8KYU4_9FUNG|nr:hypothetical protein EDC05_001934 [Coemansia umbellata]KAJ2623150.1 hypothetical protein GGI26_002564 [Coemansia sp. RSA 1358]KAJ2680028.1 hypothetical protein GGI25_000916 [Coemansia spiralis]